MQPPSLSTLLRANEYPGRGIFLGRSADNASAIAAYFIMGRSENSRNRVFVPTKDGIRTQAHDPKKMTDPSLVIYHPVRKAGNTLIVTNGDQTDTIRDALTGAGSPENALTARTFFASALTARTVEPDAPHYTPRISGLLSPDGSFALSILKSAEGDPRSRLHFLFSYDSPLPGEGRFLHTYQCNGDPLPSFAGEPVRAAVEGSDPDAVAAELWDALNPDNRVSLYVLFRDLASREERTAIINRHEG